MHDIILHAFDWEYKQLADNADQIAEIGYGAVLIAPPLYSDPNGSEWWQRYQPKDYRVIRSYLGGKADLSAAIKALHDKGVMVYADIVFNHMANESSREERKNDSLNFPGTVELLKYREQQQFEEDRLYGNLDTGLFS